MTDLLDRIRSLTPQQKELLLRKLARHDRRSESPARQASTQRLSAFLVLKEFGIPPSQQELREHLSQSLPDYMVPAEFVTLDAIPLTPNGKADRAALLHMEAEETAFDQGSFVPPRTDVEETLARIWRDLLGFDEISIHDNFLEIGGDSLISIRVIARANEAGLSLSPQLLFDHPTIAELAALLEKKTAAETPQEPVYGDFPLLPIQQWFLEWDHPEPSHWNQAILLETQVDFDVRAMAEVLQELVTHHDALRMSVKQTGGTWTGHITEAGTLQLERFDLSSHQPVQRLKAIEQEATRLQRSLNITQGPIVRAAYFHFGPGEPGRLLLLLHHLAVDWISWGIILDDLPRLYRAFQDAAPAKSPLPSKTTSIKTWAKHLVEYASSPRLAKEIDFWAAETSLSEPDLPMDDPGGENTVASEQEITVALPEEVTAQLFSSANQAYQTRVEELLLTALVKTFSDWTGNSSLRVGLEGHGREDLFDGLDLSRTVGWFTSYYPLRLTLDHPDDAGASIKQIKEKFRSVPHHGIGYGVLRYLAENPDAAAVQTSPYPRVLFNYLGRRGYLSSEDSPFKLVYETVGRERSLEGMRRYQIEINSYVQNDRLHLTWTYSRNIHSRDTMAALSENYLSTLSRLIAHCLDPESGGFTPSDFPLAGLDEGELDKLSDLLSQID